MVDGPKEAQEGRKEDEEVDDGSDDDDGHDIHRPRRVSKEKHKKPILINEYETLRMEHVHFFLCFFFTSSFSRSSER